MRHRVQKRSFNRDTNHRKALIKNLVTSLVMHGTVVTTIAKAKEVSRVADKLIGKAKADNLNTRRQLHRFFGKRDVVNTLVDRVAPVFTERVSGFTSIARVGARRGDNTQMARLTLVKTPEVTGTLRAPKVADSSKKQEQPPKEAAPKQSAAKPKKSTKAKTAPKAAKTEKAQ